MPICKHPLHSWHNRLTNYKKTYDSIEIEFANHRQNSLILSPIALRNLNNFVKISLIGKIMTNIKKNKNKIDYPPYKCKVRSLNDIYYDYNHSLQFGK